VAKLRRHAAGLQGRYDVNRAIHKITFIECIQAEAVIETGLSGDGRKSGGAGAPGRRGPHRGGCPRGCLARAGHRRAGPRPELPFATSCYHFGGKLFKRTCLITSDNVLTYQLGAGSSAHGVQVKHRGTHQKMCILHQAGMVSPGLVWPGEHAHARVEGPRRAGPMSGRGVEPAGAGARPGRGRANHRPRPGQYPGDRERDRSLL
jgi:hypothetical protein